MNNIKEKRRPKEGRGRTSWKTGGAAASQLNAKHVCTRHASQKMPLANTKQMKSLQQVKVRMKTTF